MLMVRASIMYCVACDEGADFVLSGQSAAKSLAISNPTLAIANPDSHEYFSENTPVLS